MADNVISLPRPAQSRPQASRMGLYLRVGHNQHKEMLDALASGKGDFSGIVVDAGKLERHDELIAHAYQANLDVILDPKTHAMGTPGGFTKSMGGLPWGNETPQSLIDYQGELGKAKAYQIADFAQEHKFTQILGPTHLLGGPNDPWLRCDIDNLMHLRKSLEEAKSDVQLIYPLAISIKVMRDSLLRDAIISSLKDAPMDALWLRIENFGADATGEKTVAYIEAARDFQQLGVPIIADYVGGLSSSGLLSFGAVGGVAQGITMLDKCNISAWRRPPKQDGRSGGPPPTRVYIPQLDMFLKPREADAFLRSSSRTKGKLGCTDTHCCAAGLRDQVENPARHFIYQRSREVREISERPASIRVQEYMEKTVRPVSDNVSAALGLGAISDEMRKKLGKKQKLMSGFRGAMAHFAERDASESLASTPLSRPEREARKS